MAIASKINAVQLNLTMEQAYYLYNVLLNVGGDPKGPRGQIDQVYTSLTKFRGDFEDVATDLPDLYCEGTVILDNLPDFS